LLTNLNNSANRSLNLVKNNHAIMNNFFVKLSRINGVLFPSEVGDILLWHSNFNDKLVSLRDNFNYVLNQGLNLTIFDKENTTKDSLAKIKSSLYEMNAQLGDKMLDEKIVDQKDLKKNIRDFNDFVDSLYVILGNQKQTKHLVIFQNPYNLTATGGK